MNKESQKPTSATEEVDNTPPEVTINPLGMEYAKTVVEKWPKTPQAQTMIPRLPQGLKEMLEKQSDEFVLGFANGIQCSHDLGIKMLLDDVRGRMIAMQQASKIITPDNMMPSSQLSYPIDRAVITAAALVEGIGYLACAALLNKQKETEDNED